MLLPHTTPKLYTAEITKCSNDVVLSHGAVRFGALCSNRTSSYSFASDKTAKDGIVGSHKKSIRTLPPNPKTDNAPHHGVEV